MTDLTDKPRPQILVAYHANCIDGFTSAWIATRFLETVEGATVTLLAMSYDKESSDRLAKFVTECKLDELYVVDFSLDIDVLNAMHCAKPDTKVIILDHHKTAFERYMPEHEVTPLSYIRTEIHGASIYLDNNKSGAGLTWDYFYGSKSLVPELVKYVQDYDIWRYEFGDRTKYINKYIQTQDMYMDNWEFLHSCMEDPANRADLLRKGKVLQEDHDETVAGITEGAYPTELRGEKGLAVGCSYKYASDVGHALAVKSGTFGATYERVPDKQEVKWSLRSNGDYDVSAIAKKLGGGGHKNAAGFRTEIGIEND